MQLRRVLQAEERDQSSCRSGSGSPRRFLLKVRLYYQQLTT
jgi:hypothetical protein